MRKREGSIKRYSADELRTMRARGEGRTDWARVDSIGAGELTSRPAEDADEARLPEDWPDGVEIGLPRAKRHLNLRIDADIVDWFRRDGRGYQTRMNAVLRAYVQAQRRRGHSR